MRAQIKLMQHVKNNIIRPKIDGIKQLYYSINRNANYNANSVEARAIRKHLYMAQAELTEIKEMIDENKTALRTYLEEKETFKQSIRKHRNSSNKDNID